MSKGNRFSVLGSVVMCVVDKKSLIECFLKICSAVVENYEKTMVEMISEREQSSQNYEKQLLQLKTERDANFHHLTSLENTFSDLHL